MGPYRIHATDQLIAGNLSIADLRQFQDCIGVMVRLNDSWQCAEFENGLNIAVINPNSFHWDDRSPGEVATFLSKRANTESAAIVENAAKTKHAAILTSTGEIVTDLSERDLRGFQDCISMLMTMDDSWSGCRGDSGNAFTVTNTTDAANEESALSWMAEEEVTTA
ncbi:MAG: hypothetical protein HOH43_14830 [Candidatus Latescibacteria bacterium]|nr:hypothetical protein [Candidatus Latescibacterota bacterium]